MKKLKDLCLSVLLKEGDDVNFSISPENITSVSDVKFDKQEDYIKLTLNTTFGKKIDLIVNFDSIKKWKDANPKSANNIFNQFVKDFLNYSQESDGLNEIIDDDGNIMPDQDMPNNSTNGMVVGPKFDLEKIYKSFVPKSVRFYSGGYGMGTVTW